MATKTQPGTLNRTCQVLLTVATGRRGTRQLKLRRSAAYATAQALDNDSDSFSIDLTDDKGELNLLLDRDNEIRVSLFGTDASNGKLVQLFNGIADDAQRTEDFLISIEGRDIPSSLAVDSDAKPGRWRHVHPKRFLQQRMHDIGVSAMSIATMSEIGTLMTDGSEKEWAFWYRIARSKGMYMWSDNIGRLIIDKLVRSLKPSYYFGVPTKGTNPKAWLGVTSLTFLSQKGGRVRRVLVYAENAKQGKTFVAQGVDTTIAAWRKKPLIIMSSTKAKTIADAQKEANDEVYESIVGAQEIELTIQDTGLLIQQNKMAQINLPAYGIVGSWYIVGVARNGGPEGLSQIVRFREPGFALSKRVPPAPTITKDPADNKPVSSIAAALDDMPGVRWADSFVRATREFGVPAGWDFTLFLGVLLAMCAKESTFRNIREIPPKGVTATGVEEEWAPYDKWVNNAENLTDATSNSNQLLAKYERTFANDVSNQWNPWHSKRNAGVGPMQLTSDTPVGWADKYGFNDVPATGDEYQGGRWNPDSNIRSAARWLVVKLNAVHADPTRPDTIWAGVAAYNGSQAYADDVRANYFPQYYADAQAAVAAAKAVPANSTESSFSIPGHGEVSLPANTPDEAIKAINFCRARVGDKYEWGGTGPLYDCSSLVTKALASASARLRGMVDEPVQGKSHGDTTYTLFTKGRFPAPTRDNLLPGDLVFFHGNPPWHVGMYIVDDIVIHDPHPGDVVKYSMLGDMGDYTGARRLVDWSNTGSASDATENKTGTVKSVMIQAGHDPGGHGDQPYGHSGESGAVGELAFNRAVRDKVLAFLAADSRFDGVPGNAWSASAGEGSGTGDDINWSGDMFISLHYDRGTSGSGYFFGYTRGSTDGRSDGVSSNSARLADKIAAQINLVSGNPPRLGDNTNFGGSPANATGWGYYAWGSSERTAPNNVNHLPSVPVAIILENGRSEDGDYLDNKRKEIARAIYRGICAYYGYTPVGS